MNLVKNLTSKQFPMVLCVGPPLFSCAGLPAAEGIKALFLGRAKKRASDQKYTSP
jgi:hypothetical protein